MENRQIELLIADDHLLFIEGLKALFKDDNSVIVKSVAQDGRILVDQLINFGRFDVLLLDINMPKTNGLDLITYIKKNFPYLKIIILSTYGDIQLIKSAKHLGADGYLLKNCSKVELLNCIQKVFIGNTFFKILEDNEISSSEPFDLFLKTFSLTKREVEIIKMIKTHMTNQEIARHLYLSLYTIETHRKNIMHKLGFKHPSELIRFAIENDL